VLFGSGEISATGRKIHDEIFRRLHFVAPVAVGILETPTGFETNAIHAWPERVEAFFKTSLKNYQPDVTRIRAWRRNGQFSTDAADIVDAILEQDYLYSGAGSPTYFIRHITKTRAYDNLLSAHKNGTTLCLGSASAIAAGKYALPVYEIFKAGADPYWLSGLNIFHSWHMDMTIIPHWNNQEGEDFDTEKCWMGEDRFTRLESLLPPGETILGIDEQTACILDVTTRSCDVLGTGMVHVRKNDTESVYKSGTSFIFRG
jgi:hypothetical protein